MKWSLLVLILVVGAGASALADPVDPDPNGIGIYFDEGAIDQSWCANAAVGSQVTAYLCLTRATDSSGFTIRGDGTNAAVEPEFVVSYGTPLPYQLSTVLLDITVDVIWEWSTALRVWPASSPSGGVELPAYATTTSGGVYQTLGYSFSWDPVTKIPNWCASINDADCLQGPSVPAQESSWGRVKALYR